MVRFPGEVIVFTGTLSIPRREAADLAASSGCKVTENVTKKSTMLVVGDVDVPKLAGNVKTSKHRKAEKLIVDGVPIRIIRETDFKSLVFSSLKNFSAFAEFDDGGPEPMRGGRRASCLVPWVSSIGVRCSALRELERSLGTPNSEFGDLIETAKMNRVEPFALSESRARGHRGRTSRCTRQSPGPIPADRSGARTHRCAWARWRSGDQLVCMAWVHSLEPHSHPSNLGSRRAGRAPVCPFGRLQPAALHRRAGDRPEQLAPGRTWLVPESWRRIAALHVIVQPMRLTHNLR